MKKDLSEKLPVTVYTKHVTSTNSFYLLIQRSVDFDGKPFKNGNRWNPTFIAVEITQEEADKLFHQMGVPRKVGISF